MSWLRRYKSIFFLTVATIFLLLAQSAYWLNHTIFDQRSFNNIVSTTLQSESSREAIAQNIINRALEDKPILRRTVGPQATQLVTGLLGTDLATQSFNTVIDRTYAYLTSENPQPIAIDLTSIKVPLSGLVSFAERLGREVTFDPSFIPDSIELFNPKNIPDFYSYSIALLWLGPLFWLSSFIIFATYIYRGRVVYAKRVYIVGSLFIAVSGIGLLFGPIIPPTVAALVPTLELRPVVGDLISNLLQPFTRQMYVTIIVTSLILVCFNQRHQFAKLAIGVSNKISSTPKTTTKEKKK
jgi:hypothetical protein